MGSTSGSSVTGSTSGAGLSTVSSSSWMPLLRPAFVRAARVRRRQAPQAVEGIVYLKMDKKRNRLTGKVVNRVDFMWSKKGAVLEKGVLVLFHPKTGCKTDSQLIRIDLGRAIVSVKMKTTKREFRFDLSDEGYKMTTKHDDFDKWHAGLQQHRLFKEYRNMQEKRRVQQSTEAKREVRAVKKASPSVSSSSSSSGQVRTEATKIVRAVAKRKRKEEDAKTKAPPKETLLIEKNQKAELKSEYVFDAPIPQPAPIKPAQAKVTVAKPTTPLTKPTVKQELKEITDTKPSKKLPTVSDISTAKILKSTPKKPETAEKKEKNEENNNKEQIDEDSSAVSDSDASNNDDKAYRSLLVELDYKHFEPLSVLQAFCEQLKFSSLVDQALTESKAVPRMALVAAFAASNHARTVYRKSLSLPAAIGETFEMDKAEFGWRLHAEQVDRNTSVCHVEGNGWSLSMTQLIYFEKPFNSNAHKNLIVLEPECRICLRLQKFDTEYTWHKVNILLDLKPNSINMYPYGDISIAESKHQTRAKLSFLKPRHHTYGAEINGQIFEGGLIAYNLVGSCSQGLFRVTSIGLRWSLFSAPPAEMYDSKFYGFGSFAKQLNVRNGRTDLPPTDSRNRPDIKWLLNGRRKEALESTNKLLPKTTTRPKPIWFAHVRGPEGTVWTSNGTYWTARKNNFKDISFRPLW